MGGGFSEKYTLASRNPFRNFSFARGVYLLSLVTDTVFVILTLVAASQAKTTFEALVAQTSPTTHVCGTDRFWGPIVIFPKVAQFECQELSSSADYFSGRFWSGISATTARDDLVSHRNGWFVFYCIYLVLVLLVLAQKQLPCCAVVEVGHEDEPKKKQQDLTEVWLLITSHFFVLNTYMLDVRDDRLAQPFISEGMMIANLVTCLVLPCVLMCLVGGMMVAGTSSGGPVPFEAGGALTAVLCALCCVLLPLIALLTIPTFGYIFISVNFYGEAEASSTNWDSSPLDDDIADTMGFLKTVARVMWWVTLIKGVVVYAVQVTCDKPKDSRTHPQRA